MAERKRLVLDANILIRACLGVRARVLIADFLNEAPTVSKVVRSV